MAHDNRKHLIAMALLACCISACTPKVPPEQVLDPYEATNRKVHDFNKSLDKGLIREDGPQLPGWAMARISNLGHNIGAPNDVINNMLQGRIDKSASNAWGFVINTTVGIGGLFDPAQKVGIERTYTGFGETLHFWGVGEGYYLERPFVGGIVTRDFIGSIVDIGLSPIYVYGPDALRWTKVGIHVTDAVIDRQRYGESLSYALHKSADSYAHTRFTLVEQRRFELNRSTNTTNDEDAFDPYAE